MLNPTQNALAGLARQFLNQHAARDPELILHIQNRQALWDSFRQTHRRNGALVKAVCDLLDAESLLGELRGEYQFFLGLQMGMEMGRPDLFPEV